MGTTAPLQFSPFSSQIELPFYSAFFAVKLEQDKLDDSPRRIIGLYQPRETEPAMSCKMQILGTALKGDRVRVPLDYVRAEGTIKNVNTMESFKGADKAALMQSAGKQIWDAIKDGTIYSIPSLLSSFSVLSFADLKTYRFYYWFAFPALHSDPPWRLCGPVTRLSSRQSTTLVESVGTWRYGVDVRERGFFLVKCVHISKSASDSESDAGSDSNSNFDSNSSSDSHADSDSHPVKNDAASSKSCQWEVTSLADFEKGFFHDIPVQDQYVGFVDSSTYRENPSWPLRNLLVLIRQRFKLSKVQILCFRDVHARRHEARSIILSLESSPPTADESKTERTENADQEAQTNMTCPRITGWERNDGNKLTYKQVNLADYMDPARLADQSVDLNLKLMKWRISPNLDLNIIKNTSCLLLGAGTLGGYVSRSLMAWGVRKITFVDSGNVSYSNPVRQPLYEFQHCKGSGEPKAVRAAQTLRDIYPGVQSEGHGLTVPMLGHAFTNEKRTMADFELLKTLVEGHDVIFLLMDSRESRWLPTVMGKAHGKIVMNAALGFDSFVAMRHGAEVDDGKSSTLGCYFCNDVVAPADSIKDQTLDQQCTVTRPGLAAIASGILVEILVSLLQHPLGNKAPAPFLSGAGFSVLGSSGSIARDPPDHPLGLVPHQIRGYLTSFQNVMIRGESYNCCSACSPAIVAAYRDNGWQFVRRALLEREYIAQLSGLTEVQRRAEEVAAQVVWDEDGEDGEAAEDGKDDGEWHME